MCKKALQLSSNFGELCEDQHTLTTVDYLFDHLPKALELMRTLGSKCASILQELHRVVTDLLEFQQSGEDQAFALDALGLIQLLCDISDHSLVERCLLR